MAKHLSNRDIDKIVELLESWTDKLTWEELCEACKTVIGTVPTRQTLCKFTKLVTAFKASKQRLKQGVLDERPQLGSIRAAQERIQRLEHENQRLKKENQELLEQFVVWQYNAYSHNLTASTLNNPLPKIDRGSTE